YAVFVSVRLEQHGALWFVHIGSHFLSAAHTSDVIRPSLGAQNTFGYDGQYYFALAADPSHAHDYMEGRAGVVYSRVFYPAVARAASAGSVTALPYAMLTINLLAVLAGTAAVALWFVKRGFSPWPAMLYGLFPGLVVTVFRDLTEPLAFALAALAVLVFDQSRTRRMVLSAILFALAVLTRETIVPFALVGAAALALDDRRRLQTAARWHRWRRAATFAAATCGPLLLLRLVVMVWLNEPTQEVGHERGWILPLHGIWSWWPFDTDHWLIVLAVTLPALAAAAGALVLLRRRQSVVLAGLLLVNVLLYVVWLPRAVYIDDSAASRAAIGVVLAALYCLPGWWTGSRGRVVVVAGAASLSIGWYLIAAALLGLPGIQTITT
ncbi:MAG: hypothetical protein M3O89_04845, partial [Actinomycetota bacterium]|nr:hypothetical protein [Actinomycetota bacterium]